MAVSDDEPRFEIALDGVLRLIREGRILDSPQVAQETIRSNWVYNFSGLPIQNSIDYSIVEHSTNSAVANGDQIGRTRGAKLEQSSPVAMNVHALVLFCLLIFCYAFIHQKMGANQNSRLDVLHSLYVHQTLRIDAYQANTTDKSYFRDHYYSDKAPGIVVLALPSFGMSWAVLKLFGISVDSPQGWVLSSWITTVGSVGLITAFGAVAMFYLLCRFVAQTIAFASCLIVFLGSAPFPYATMLFSHAAVMGLICIAFWAIGDNLFFEKLFVTFSGEPHLGTPNRELSRHMLAGFCCGLSIASEYTSAVAAIALVFLTCLVSVKRSVLVVISAIVPLLLIPLNNLLCFGGPLVFGYHKLAEAGFHKMNNGLFGITFPPKCGAAYLLLLSPERGLVFWTPFYAIVFLGIRYLYRAAPKVCCVCVTVTILHVICISGYYMPSGGSALGPRHLAPILPFVTVVSVLGFQRNRLVGLILGLYSLVLTGVATTIDAMPHSNMRNPLVESHLLLLIRGEFTQNVPSCLGAPSYVGEVIILIVMFSLYSYAAFQVRNVKT